MKRKIIVFFKKPPFIMNFILVFIGIIIPELVFDESYATLWEFFLYISFVFCVSISYTKQTKWIHYFFSQIIFFLTIYILYLISEYIFENNIFDDFQINNVSSIILNFSPIESIFILTILNLIVQTIAFILAKIIKYVFNYFGKSKDEKE